ncbi:hypothetical protein ACA910_009750 [Epithemia clementina (nom. ined.)]
MVSHLTTTAFSPAQISSRPNNAASLSTTQLAGATTVEAPTRERTDRKTGSSYDRVQYNDLDDYNDDDDDDDDDLEYYMDPNASRTKDDPFHILLLGSTFEKPKVTVPYVSSTLEYVISMPSFEAVEQAKFAKDQGLSCLGTWPREKCLSLGKQLQRRDLVCRVVPYCEGGQRGWQAKDVSSASSASSSSKSGSVSQ